MHPYCITFTQDSVVFVVALGISNPVQTVVIAFLLIQPELCRLSFSETLTHRDAPVFTDSRWGSKDAVLA